MNLNDEDEEEALFTQHCLELAKLLRTEQTERFLHLYDSLPAGWTVCRLEAAKESIRQLQELDENEFEQLYQRAFHHRDSEPNPSTTSMSKQASTVRTDDHHTEQSIVGNSRVTSLAILQQQQHLERTTANNLACDEQHDIVSKHSSVSKHGDEFSAKSWQRDSIRNNASHEMTSNNYRTQTPVDSFVKLNLKPPMEISLQDYKKAKDSSPTTKTSSINNRSSLFPSRDVSDSSAQSITPRNMNKNHRKSLENQYHEEASLDYFFKNDEDDRQQSRSSSSSPTTSLSSSAKKKNDSTKSQPMPREHSKLIASNDFDSHGSSIATKSSSENSSSARTGSGSDSDDEQHQLHIKKKPDASSTTKATLLSPNNLFKNDATLTMVLNTTSDHPFTQHDRILSLPPQDSYELVQSNPNTEHRFCAGQVPRFKLSALDDPNGSAYSSNDILSYTTQRPQAGNLTSSSQPNQNLERHDQYNTHHSNSSRKSATRPSKKRKQLQQQETIRTELIPGHRGDLDVDELVMFIDGNSSSKQRTSSAPLRLTDTNSNSTNTTATRRKSRKTSKVLQEGSPNTTNENKTSHADEDTQSASFIDEDDETTTTTTTSTYATENPDPIHASLSNDEESQLTAADIESPNTTNGEISVREWLEPTRSTSSTNDDNDSLSLSSATLNNSNSEITSEPFVTVTHRRRFTKERRQDSNPSSSRSPYYPASSNTNDKRRFQPPASSSSSSAQNGTVRSALRNGLSNSKPFASTATREETTSLPVQSVSQPSVPPPPPPLSVSSNLNEQLSPRLSSHSSSSSLSSSLKRQSKPPPVVFLNKSEDVELNDVSFGFDVENPTAEKSLTETRSSSSPPPAFEIEKEAEHLASMHLNGPSTDSNPSPSRRAQQRTNRGPLFSSGSDIRPQQYAQHRTCPTQTTAPRASYIDPLLLHQYNQQRLAASYSQFAYMNFLRSQYIPSQSPYVLIPAPYPTTTETNQETKDPDDEPPAGSEQIQEPLLVYATIPTQLGPIYLPPTNKGTNDLEQQIPTPAMYPSPYFYHPTLIPNTAYFQPISSPSYVSEGKSQQHDTDDEDDDHDYEKATRSFHQTRQQSSSHIMSNALQLVYSQEKRSAQTDRFNLDQLTAYLSMKWTDAVNHYEQGDDQIVLAGEQ